MSEEGRLLCDNCEENEALYDWYGELGRRCISRSLHCNSQIYISTYIYLYTQTAPSASRSNASTVTGLFIRASAARTTFASTWIPHARRYALVYLCVCV
jgi:hypothetical protein